MICPATSRTSIALALWVDTVWALLSARRALPILAISLPLLAAQHSYSPRPLVADSLAVFMIFSFLAVAPFAWRWTSSGSWGWLLYVPFSLLPFGLAVAMTTLGELTESFLVNGVNAAIGMGLFLVGGWGLGRDIDLEQGMASLQRQARAAELMAIRSHLDPHFLFNTLNAIAEWCTLDPEQAEIAILRLSQLLREILGGIQAESWPLERELAIAVDVLELHRIRDPTWFELEVAGPAPGEVPPLLLLPIVENAVKHGPAIGSRGTISLRITWVEGRRTIEVRNPGPLGPPRKGGQGLRMVRERLRLAYGDKANFTLEQVGEDTVARVTLP